MNILFLHQSFPGQYRHIAQHLAASSANKIVFLTQHRAIRLPRVKTITYSIEERTPQLCHPYTLEIDRAITIGAAVADACKKLTQSGFRPDLIVGHAGWGETLFVRDVFPNVPLLANFEFYYHATGADVGFDSEFDSVFNSPSRLLTRNATALLAAETATWGHTATRWQASQLPNHIQERLTILHEGVDTDSVRPNSRARLTLPTGRVLTFGDEVVTYCARSLEPYRGFHTFMRARPSVLRQHPKAQVVLMGDDSQGYGAPPPPGGTFRQMMLKELGDTLDLSRVHFLGHVDYAQYIRALQVSKVHVYLTYPFILSWSFIEALAAGCLVIGSNTAPVLEILHHNVNGLIVDFFSANEIAAAIHKGLSQSTAMAKHRTAARQTAVSKFDLKRCILPRWTTMFRDLIAHKIPQNK